MDEYILISPDDPGEFTVAVKPLNVISAAALSILPGHINFPVVVVAVPPTTNISAFPVL